MKKYRSVCNTNYGRKQDEWATQRNAFVNSPIENPTVNCEFILMILKQILWKVTCPSYMIEQKFINFNYKHLKKLIRL